MTDLQKLLDQIDRHDREATKGPWREAGEDGEWHLLPPATGALLIQSIPPEQSQKDAEFIALSRTALPALSRAIRAVLELHKPEQIEAWHEDCIEGYCEHNEADKCPTILITVCLGCHNFAEDIYSYATEGEGIQKVEYPCETVRAITDAMEADDAQ